MYFVIVDYNIFVYFVIVDYNIFVYFVIVEYRITVQQAGSMMVDARANSLSHGLLFVLLFRRRYFLIDFFKFVFTESKVVLLFQISNNPSDLIFIKKI